MGRVEAKWDQKYRVRAQSGKITHRELETWIAKAKPGDSLPFGGNVQLEISPAGTALWRTTTGFARRRTGS